MTDKSMEHFAEQPRESIEDRPVELEIHLREDEVQAGIETEQLEGHAFPLDQLAILVQAKQPLTLALLGKQHLSIELVELYDLGGELDYIAFDGKLVTIYAGELEEAGYSDGDPIILLPGMFGNPPTEK